MPNAQPKNSGGPKVNSTPRRDVVHGAAIVNADVMIRDPPTAT